VELRALQQRQPHALILEMPCCKTLQGIAQCNHIPTTTSSDTTTTILPPRGSDYK
jgi:hypothetical protein